MRTLDRILPGQALLPKLLNPALLCCMVMVGLMAVALPAQAKKAVKRGEYLTTILGCGGCHTEGALLGQPTGDWLTGSRIGVAYTPDAPDQSPGIIFPGNLTPDEETGIGRLVRRQGNVGLSDHQCLNRQQ